jgi:23S rRNA (adenine2030-N6)-methyltransferase
MNYRHAYHAGNFADVMKHTALTHVLAHLLKKDSPFAVIDTHAGRGLYDLSAMEAEKTGEAAEGMGRLWGGAPAPLASYVEAVSGFGDGKYPGSPLIAARMLRAKDRLIAIEKHVAEFAALKIALAPYGRARPVAGDGYAELKRLLPPPEKRGLVLIDPPYEDDDEPARVGEAIDAALTRFPTGIYMIWFPIKNGHDADALGGEILNAGAKKLLLLTVEVGEKQEAPSGRLSACGLFVINPPYGFADAMREALAAMTTALAQGESAYASVEWLAGGE